MFGHAQDVHQRGNLRFPQSLPEFQRLFPDDAACAAYLEKARWSDGFVCPHCQAAGEPFRFANRPGVLRCRKCRRDTGLTVGTVMARSHTPLSVWFWSAYLVSSQTPGVSAVQLRRQLGLSRYETAFQILHKLRAGMVRPDQDRIGGRPGEHVEVDETLPIRLLPTLPTCRMLPGSGVKLCVGRCGDVARDAEQGTEGVERIEPPVEAEGEFVEVGLQVLVTDPVMDAVQPRFQVCEDEMDDWQILLGDLRIAPFSDGEVFVAALGKAGVAAPVVGDERRARHNGALNEAAEQLRAAVRHDGEPNPPGIATTLPLVELGARLALANLHSAGDKNLIVDATAFAARPAASPGFIDFDVLAGPAADPVLIRAHHPRAELVEDLERRLVARQAKLSPKLHGRHAGCLAGHQIGRPKPYAQRRVRARHDRSHRQSGVTAALAAAQDARTICEAERLSRRLTMGANKPVAPASLLQVGGAGRVVGKKSLELWKRLWEPKIATLVNVHEHGRTLPLVAVGDNRIGKVRSILSARSAGNQSRLRQRNSWHTEILARSATSDATADHTKCIINRPPPQVL